VKEIQLTQGQFAQVDDADYEWLNQWKWYALWDKTSKSFYAVRSTKVHECDKRTTVYMHRQILGLDRGDPLTGDHDDHNTLNNRRYNLRRANKGQQQHNQGICANNTSGLKGVRKHGNGYRARIGVNGKTKCLGTRPTPEAAYLELWVPAALELHAEFARLA
jgi:hypothetical protein